MTPEMLEKKPHGKSIDWYGIGVLLYEMLVSIPPYYASNQQQLYDNILNAPLKMPTKLSGDCQDLLKKLLRRNAQERLGANKGFDEIRRHPWFKTVNWKDVYLRKESAIPTFKASNLKNRVDRINMDSLYQNPGITRSMTYRNP